MIRRRSLSALAAALAVPALPARARVVLRDAAGQEVRLPRPAERIVLGFNFEEYLAVAGPGGWDRVVGFNRRQWAVNRPAVWQHYLARFPALEALADVGATENQSLSAERVIALRPDLFVIHAVGYRAQADAMARIAAAGIPILIIDYNAQDLALHRASTLALGAAVGQEARALELVASYESQRARVIDRAAAIARRPPTYVELGIGGPGAIGNSYAGTMWGRMVEQAGGRNIAEGRIPAGFSPLSAEAVLAAAPEHVVLVGATWTNRTGSARAGYGVSEAEARASLTPYVTRPGWGGLPAMREGNLSVVESGLTRSLMDWIALHYLARRLHPDVFGDLDAELELRRWHEAWLPVPFSGCWMASLS
jgi:iron complex transport system substrate-binding protein